MSLAACVGVTTVIRLRIKRTNSVRYHMCVLLAKTNPSGIITCEHYVGITNGGYMK